MTAEELRSIGKPVRTLLDHEHSPLRIMFHDDDPAKDRTLDCVHAAQEHVEHAQGSDATILIRTSWEDAYKLMAAGIRVGDPPFTDPLTAQARISGYALIRTGMLTEQLEVTVELTDEERRAGHLPPHPSRADWQNAVMSLYIDNLGKVAIETGDLDLATLYGKLVEVWKQV